MREVKITRAVAGRWLRRGDLLARLGGDEFLVALPGLDPATAREEAVAVAGSLTAAVREPQDVAGRTVGMGVSIGVSVFPGDAEDRDGLLHAADVRMCEHKAALRR